jgi:hypothetical protein
MTKYFLMWLGGLVATALVIGAVWYVLPKAPATPAVNTNQPVPTLAEVQVFEPAEGSVVTSPLKVYGRAPGNWFFEANLPVSLLDEAGNELARVGAQAQSEWMVTTPVEFRATLNFTQPSTETGYLQVQNDNPSGLPQFEKSYRIKVRFK